MVTTQASTDIQKEPGRRHRVAASDFSVAKEVMKAAMLLLVPDDQGQRQAFKEMIPNIFVMRSRQCSWQQITSLLKECGFKLEPTTVRNYYGEMVQDQLDRCEQMMNEHNLLEKEVNKQIKYVDVRALTGDTSGTVKPANDTTPK